MSTKRSSVMELLLKVDPSKPYFCKNIKDIRIELESTVRNTGGSMQERGQRSVRYAAQEPWSLGVGTQMDDDDDRDDETHAYDPYQAEPAFEGHDGQAPAEHVLKIELNRQ